MSMLGTLIVRIAANLVGFKGDLDKAAKDTADAAAKIEGSTSKAGAATGGLADKLEAARKVAGAANGDLLGAAQGAQALSAGAGVAVIGVGLLVAGLAAAAYAAHTGAQESKAYDKALILTGNAAGTNASQMQAMAAGIDKVVGTQAQAAAGLAQMAGTGLVAGNNLQKFTQVAIEMERGVGVAVGDTVKQFAALGADPVKASLRLNETTNYLTASTFAQIKAAEELGDKELAASLAQNAYADAMEVRTAKIAANVGTLENIWKGLGDVAAWAWDKMLGIGRENGPEQVLEKAKAGLANLEKLDVERRAGAALGSLGGELQVKIAAAKQQVTLAQETVKLSQRASQLQADGVVTEKAKIAWIESGNKFLTERQKKDAEILLVRKQGLAALASEEDIQKRIAVIEAKGASARAGKPKVDKGDALELAKQASLLSTLSGVNADYQEQLTRLQSIRAKGNISEAEYLRLVNELIGKQPMAKKLIDDHTKATELMAKANLAGAEAHRKYVDSLEDGAGKLEKEVQQLREHNERIGLGKVAVAELDAAKLEATANTLESFAIRELDKNLNEAEYELTKRQIAALRDKAALTREGAGKEVAVDQAKKASEAWNKTAGDIQKELTDSLMRGFEKGKTFAENLRDTVVNMFKTMVLRPTVSAIVNAGANALGLGSNAAGASGGGLLGAASNASSLYSAGTSIATVGSQVISGGMSVANAVGTIGANATGTGISGLLASNGAYGTAAAGAGGAFSGIGAAIGAIPVWGQIALGVGALAAAIGLFGKDKPKSKGTGNAAVNFDAEGNRTNTSYQAGAGGASAASDAALAAMSKGYLAAAKGLGLTARDSFFAIGGHGTEGEKDHKFRISGGSNTDKAYFDSGVQAATPEAMELAASRAVFAALAGSELPRQLAGLFDGHDINAITQEGIDNVLKKGVALQQLDVALNSLPIENLTNLSYTAAAGLIAASGGIEALASNAAGYYNNFYTQEEQRLQTVKAINAEVAATGFDAATGTRASFRALLDAQDKNTEAGQRNIASLLRVQAAFASITPELDRVSAAADSVSEAMKRLIDVRDTQAIELMRAQGNTAGADAAQYTADTEGLTDAERALFDYNAAVRKQIDTLNAATEAAKAEEQRQVGLASQRAQQEIQIMQLQGNAAGALAAQRAIELAAMDEVQRPLQAVIYGLQDLASAAAATAAAANAAASNYFAAIDRDANAANLASSAQSGIDKFFGTVAEAGSSNLQLAKAAQEAAKSAADNWRSIASTIRSTLESFKAKSIALNPPALDSARAQLSMLASLAQGGDAASAAKIAGALGVFESALDQDAKTDLQVQRERGRAELMLEKTLTVAESGATVQDSIAASSAAAVTQLTAMNENLTGFAGEIFDLLQRGYTGADRKTAQGAATSYANASADFDNYFATTAEGSSRAFAGGTLTRLAGDRAQFTNAAGQTDYIRAGESLLDVGKRVAAIRNQWESQYGLRLPSFDVGTNYVPHDMTAKIHKGEAIIPKAFNPAAGGFGLSIGGESGTSMERTETLLRATVAELSGLRVEVRAVVVSSRKTADTLVKVSQNGDAFRMLEVTE